MNNGDFFKFKLGDIINSLLLLIAVAALLLPRFEGSSASNEDVKSLSATVEKLATHVDDIDKRGTLGSSKMDTDRFVEEERRISILEAQVLPLIPDVREIKTKLNFVADLLDEQRKAKR